MGGSTNTRVLHILAVAQEAGVNFTMADIDRLSRKVPNICKVAPSSQHHLEDVHRAGGIFTILGELDRAGLIHREARTVHAATMGQAIAENDIHRNTASEAARKTAPWRRRAACRRRSHSRRKSTSQAPDTDVEKGCIRDVAHAYSKDGGFGRSVRQPGQGRLHREDRGRGPIHPALRGSGAGLPFAELACEAILANRIKPGDVVVIVYESRRKRPPKPHSPSKP